MDGAWHAGARLGIATLSGRPLGLAADVHGAYELSDVFDVVVQVTGSIHRGDHLSFDGSGEPGEEPGADLLAASGGLAYKIDVFEWIPYVSLLGGYYYRHDVPARISSGRAGVSLHAGLDYLVRRDLAVGADFGWHTMFEDGLSMPYFTVLAGAEYRFGW